MELYIYQLSTPFRRFVRLMSTYSPSINIDDNGSIEYDLVDGDFVGRLYVTFFLDLWQFFDGARGANGLHNVDELIFRMKKIADEWDLNTSFNSLPREFFEALADNFDNLSQYAGAYQSDN